jgi:hypothetical protein
LACPNIAAKGSSPDRPSQRMSAIGISSKYYRLLVPAKLSSASVDRPVSIPTM